MNKNKITIGAAILAAAIVIVGAASISYAFSQGGGNGFPKNGQGNNQEKMQANKSALEQAFANNDYAAWKNIMEEQKSGMAKRLEDFSAKINEETFSKLSEIRKLISEGKTEEAKTIRQELGEIGFGFGNGFGRGLGRHQGFVDANNNGICDNLEE